MQNQILNTLREQAETIAARAVAELKELQKRRFSLPHEIKDETS